MPIIIDEIDGTTEPPPHPPKAPHDENTEIEAAARRALELIALAREREARLAPP
jgi:hypothetical protein